MLPRLGCLLAVSSCARRSRGTYWPKCPATAKEGAHGRKPTFDTPIGTAVSGHVHGCFQGCTKKIGGMVRACCSDDGIGVAAVSTPRDVELGWQWLHGTP